MISATTSLVKSLEWVPYSRPELVFFGVNHAPVPVHAWVQEHDRTGGIAEWFRGEVSDMLVVACGVYGKTADAREDNNWMCHGSAFGGSSGFEIAGGGLNIILRSLSG